MTAEAEFQRQVTDLAQLYGWRWFHVHDSRRSNPGFPDLVLVKDDRLIFAELKSEKGRLTPNQLAWWKALYVVPGVLALIWRPADLPEIARLLGPNGLSRPPAVTWMADYSRRPSPDGCGAS